MKPKYQRTEWIDIFRYLFQHWKQIFIICGIVAIASAGISLTIHNYYKSSANLLPNRQRGVNLGMLSQGGGISSLASSLLSGESEEASRYLVLLNSYTTKKRVIDKFDLTKVYETQESDSPLRDAMDVLDSNTNFASLEEGNFLIEVWDKDPEKAKKIADYYVEILNERNTQIATREAKLYRQFVEKRYRKSRADLDSLRDRMKNFQEKYGIFELPSQVSSYFSLLGEVTARKVEAEIQLDVLNQTVQKDNEAYKQAMQRYNAVNDKLQQLYNEKDSKNIILNFEQLPEAGATYFDLEKDLKIQTEIQKYLVPMYEQAKMQEAKSLPIVTVVDSPTVPPKKDWPRRSIIVILATISAFLISLVYYTVKLSYVNNKEYFSYINS